MPCCNVGDLPAMEGLQLPLLEETGHMPSEKYAHAPEILAHCQRIGKQYGLYEHALFHTEVVSLDWDEAKSRWTIRTSRGDAFTAQFVGMGQMRLREFDQDG